MGQFFGDWRIVEGRTYDCMDFIKLLRHEGADVTKWVSSLMIEGLAVKGEPQIAWTSSNTTVYYAFFIDLYKNSLSNVFIFL